jgi:hypothetical protein
LISELRMLMKSIGSDTLPDKKSGIGNEQTENVERADQPRSS